MASRHTSVVSVKQRKYSTDRHQRQADLSLRLEEGRPLRPLAVQEEDVPFSFREDFFSQPSSEKSTTLTRADTERSPLEAHPGHRIRGFSLAHRSDTRNTISSNRVKPWKEPSTEQEDDIDRRFAIFKRKETDLENADQVQEQIQRPASEPRVPPKTFNQVYRRLSGKPPIKPGVIQGLGYTASLFTSHATATLSQKSPRWYKRRRLYVLEYTIDRGVFSCEPVDFTTVASLKQYLEESKKTPKFRIIYACNNEEAINFVSTEFAISDSSSSQGERSFRQWMQNEQHSRHASNKAIRWRPAFDTARGMICSAFGIDFGSIPADDDASKSNMDLPQNKQATDKKSSSSSPFFRQRIAVYMQRASSAAVPGPKVTQFNSVSKNLAPHATVDTMVICEYSSDGLGEIVHTGALLALNPPLNSTDLPSSSAGAIGSVIGHILEEVRHVWQVQIASMHEKHAELEDTIYSRPADSSPARDVWTMSKRLNNMLKLINRHLKLIEAIQEDFQTFAERAEAQKWLDYLLEDFVHLAETINIDYLQPLEHMIDLMYKSVTIRDSRQSLELNASLWRLSWITFVFLPMTFLVGLFGMNVSTFKDYPSIKWYFAALIPLFGIVFSFWFAFRQWAPGSQLPFRHEVHTAPDPSSFRSRLSALTWNSSEAKIQ